MKQEQQGELLLLGEMLLWAFFPIITIFSCNKLSPIFSLSLSSFFAAIFFAIVISFKKNWQELKIFSAYSPMLKASLMIGVFYYSLIFIASKHTSANNIAIICLT